MNVLTNSYSVAINQPTSYIETAVWKREKKKSLNNTRPLSIDHLSVIQINVKFFDLEFSFLSCQKSNLMRSVDATLLFLDQLLAMRV